MKYKAIEQLQQHKTQLLDTVKLDSDMQMAVWYNQHDRVTVCSNHHTLSLYTQGGYESYRQTKSGWKNGGAPNHFCLMPKYQESTWDIRGDLTFTHLYYTDQHLHNIAVKIWDKEPSNITLNELSFVNDPMISTVYRQFLLNCDWSDSTNHLQLSSASNLLLNHLLKNYSNVQWQLPRVTGGLAPHALNRLKDWIEHNLHLPLTILDLAKQVELSEYHFAHMFKKSVGLSPHQYVLKQRLTRAYDLIKHTQTELTDIALICGFSSSSHFSARFKQYYGYSPSTLRKDH